MKKSKPGKFIVEQQVPTKKAKMYAKMVKKMKKSKKC